MKLSEIAAQIDAHLKRFERDGEINLPQKTNLLPYYLAGSYTSGRWVYVVYRGFQGSTNLSRVEAEKYLAWLDAGHVGKHWEALR